MATDGNQFNLDISNFIKKVGDKADQAARKIMLDVGTSIVEMSPVGNPSLWKTKYPPKGYVGGRFRGNWQFAIGAAPSDVLENIDPNGAPTIATMQAEIQDVKFGDTGYIANNLPYANRLEYGWSTQAPAGMVRITVERFQTFVDNAANELKDK